MPEATRRKFLGNAVENLESRSMMAFAAPVIVIPDSTAAPINMLGAYTFSGGVNTASFSDPDGDGNAATNPLDNLADTYKITVQATNGTFSLSTTSGLTVFGGNTSGTSSVIYTGKGNDINTALTNAVYNASKTGTSTVTFTIQDASLTPQITTETVTFNVTAIAPVNAVPALVTSSWDPTKTVDVNNSIPLTGANLLTVSSPDATNLTVALTASGGTLKSF